MTSHKTHDQTGRDEHNEPALAKRTLNIGFDYDKGEYAVSGTLSDGRIPVFTDPQLLEMLREQTALLRILIKHNERITNEIFTEEDIENDCN